MKNEAAEDNPRDAVYSRRREENKNKIAYSKQQREKLSKTLSSIRDMGVYYCRSIVCVVHVSEGGESTWLTVNPKK